VPSQETTAVLLQSARATRLRSTRAMALRFSRATALRLPRATALRLTRATALRILRPARAIPALSAADPTSRLLRMALATESGDGDTGARRKPSDWSNKPIARGQAARLEGPRYSMQLRLPKP